MPALRVDTNYEPPRVEELSEEELASRLAKPCTPSSISTFLTPDDVNARRRAVE